MNTKSERDILDDLLDHVEQVLVAPKPECPVQQGWCYVCKITHPYGPSNEQPNTTRD